MDYKLNYISVSGNIGTGKTTLVKNLAKDLGWQALIETPSSFLYNYYLDPKRWAFCTQIDYYTQFIDHLLIIRKAKDKVLIQDRNIIETVEVFNKFQYSNNFLTEMEFKLLRNLHNKCKQVIDLNPEILIYVYCPIDVLLERIKSRGKNYENNINLDYLTRLQGCYDNWINSFNFCPVISLDSDQYNFNNKNDRIQIVEKIIDVAKSFNKSS